MRNIGERRMTTKEERIITLANKITLLEKRMERIEFVLGNIKAKEKSK